MRGAPGRGEPVHKPPGEGTSLGARRRRAKRFGQAAAVDRHRQALAAEAEAHAAQLAAAERARAARDNSELLREAVAEANNARLEARYQQGRESRLDLEAEVNSRRLVAASARIAQEEALRLELESRAAALHCALLASQQELALLRAQRDTSPPPPPVAPPSAGGAAASLVVDAATLAAANPAQPAAPVPDDRDDTIEQLRFRVRELSGSALQRSLAAATAFVDNPTNDLLSAPPDRADPPSPLLAVSHPAASPEPLPARPPVRFDWPKTLRAHSSATVRLARRPAVVPPPWIPDQ